MHIITNFVLKLLFGPGHEQDSKIPVWFRNELHEVLDQLTKKIQPTLIAVNFCGCPKFCFCVFINDHLIVHSRIFGTVYTCTITFLILTQG